MSTKLTTTTDMPESLSLDLYHAVRGFQDRLADVLVTRLRDAGGLPVSTTQLGFLAALICGDNTASSIARRLRISRQAAQKQVGEMVEQGILVVSPDPQRRNQSLITFSERGVALMSACRQVLADMDRELGANADALRAALPALQSAFDPQP